MLLRSGWSQLPLVERGSWRGAGPSVRSPAGVALQKTKRVLARYPSRKNLFIYIKEAFHLCMVIHMHGFLAEFFFFIHMLIQVQALQNTNMDMRDYII